ncbi:MAG: sulfotransferase domain-containing protein [Candidatus Omnitrophica bacterium]|nr:sulfotransferase domain-containing protein [Candidatus Omnitrophota bacterium]
MKCGITQNIAKNLVFIDGITRSGKSVFTGIIPSLRDFEHIQFYLLMELMIPAVSLGLTDAEYVKTVLRLHMGEVAYNLLLARGMNFRYEDETGVLNYKDPQVYYERLARQEGDKIIEDLLCHKRFIPFHTHDLLVNLEHLNKMDIDYKMISVFRHPIDNSHSWWTRGWGERFGVDPRSFTFCIDYEGKLVPWYVAGFEKEWLELNPKERCIKTSISLIKRAVNQYKNTSEKNKIHLIKFKDFVQNPHEQIEKICAFLNTNTTQHTEHFIRKAKCPRVLNLKERDSNLAELKSGVKKEIFELLLETSESYETDFYGLHKKENLAKEKMV